MPNDFIQQSLNHQKTMGRFYFSRHLRDYFDFHDDKHSMDRSKLIKCILSLRTNPHTPFEVEVNDSVVTKYVVRIPYDDELDVSIVIQTATWDGCPLIKTAWLNSNTDLHFTLDKTKYINK